MRVVVIGGTGHVGTYLVPRLVAAGHAVTVVTREMRAPYLPHPAWERVERVTLDRTALEAEGTFGAAIRALKPHAVIDMLCFTEASARHLVEALRGQVERFLHCGTVWIHGYNREVPTSEDAVHEPIDDYGVGKLAIERYLLDLTRTTDFAATVLHPGHIVGEGWVPLNPQGNFNPAIYTALATGAEVLLPNLGLETVHHVHADDVAQAFMLALTHWNISLGESYFIVSRGALTLRGYAEAVAGWFGREANLRYLPMDDFRAALSPAEADSSYRHIIHSTHCSPLSAMQRLGYAPAYTSLEAVKSSLEWLRAHGRLAV